jgi:hypothetical protein
MTTVIAICLAFDIWVWAILGELLNDFEESFYYVLIANLVVLLVYGIFVALAYGLSLVYFV